MAPDKFSSPKMPLFFVGHGSPMNVLNENTFTQSLRAMGNRPDLLPHPRAILVISAHWETEGTYLTEGDSPKTIHDFYGFPPALYKIQYPAPGAPDLANEIIKEVQGVDLKLDQNQWGLDHGTWSVLIPMYPLAATPVLQLSLDRNASPEFHFHLGKELAFLRTRGVLIIGSGNLVHNLRELNWDENAPPRKESIEFDSWIKDKLTARDWKSLIINPSKSKVAQWSHPSAEHYYPLLYVLGASDSEDHLHFSYEGIQNASISCRSFVLSTK